MWLTAPNRIGIAAWQAGDSVWRIDARGGREGVAIRLGEQRVGLFASGDGCLPALEEQFVRGDELHLSFPQERGDADFGFRLVVRPLRFDRFETDPGRAAFELLVSIQTTLLDSYPTIDLQLPPSGSGRGSGDPGSAYAVYVASSDDSGAAVILGSQDALAVQRRDPADAGRFTLFGEFLEKGVIRRARPWLLLNRNDREIHADWIEAAAAALANSPLPLN